METTPMPTTNGTTDVIVFMPLSARHLEMINGQVVFVLSVTLNTLLLVIVTRERNTALRAYSNVMKLNCIGDLFFTVSCLLTDFQLEISEGRLIVILVGVFEHASRAWNLFGHWLFLLGAYSSMFIIPVVFYFRYSLIVKNVILTTGQLMRVSAIPYLTAAFVCSLYVLALATDRGTKSCAELLSHPLWTHGGYTVDNCLVTSADNVVLYMFLSTVALANTLMYVLIVFCVIAIFRTLKQSEKQYSRRTSRLQRQMNTLLIVQMTLPIICACMPLTVLVTLPALKYRVIGVGLILVILVEWVPLVNPLVTILLVTNYRNRAIQLLAAPLAWSFNCKNTLGSSTVHITNGAHMTHDDSQTTVK